MTTKRSSGSGNVVLRKMSSSSSANINKNTEITEPIPDTSKDENSTGKFNWKGGKDFCLAQVQVAVILAIAYIGNTWKNTYHRNENHNPTMFWVMNVGILIVSLITLKHVPGTRPGSVQLLSRAQTEEWKGWMQWAFIMYHYYRVYYVYNEIRVFVSAYVWMTGFGNFLYFDKKQDFTIDRIVSMWLRINYFPLLLSTFLNVPLELYYVVPLHTVGFFITMATCYVAMILKEKMGWSYWNSRLSAFGLCLAVHVVFYETPLVDSLLLLSKEYHFRFQSDKYSAVIGILSGMAWKKFQQYMNWAYGSADGKGDKLVAQWLQRFAGVFLIFVWWYGFGYMSDKFIYNPQHPYIFWIPVAGWLMIRNSSKYLTELHSHTLEWLGRITLETYVLQFHLFMCQNVQHIPIVIPGSGADGSIYLKTANMLLCGSIFVAVAYWARHVTVTTQETVVELVGEVRKLLTPLKKEVSHSDSNIISINDDQIDIENAKLINSGDTTASDTS